MTTPVRRFWAPPGRDPQAPALHDAATGRWYPYGELTQMVTELADGLGTGNKRLVFLHCRNDLPTVIGLLASLEAGHAVALVDSSLEDTLYTGLEAAYRPDLVLGNGDPAAWRPSVREAGYDGGEAVHPDVAVLLSTSGTTGSPKFAKLTHANLAANAASIVAALGLKPDDRGVTTLPLHYSYGLSLLTTHLHAGARLALTDDSLVSEGLWHTFRTLGCTSLAGVPYTYQMLRRLDIDALDIPTLAVMTQAGGKLSDDAILEFHQRMAARQGRFFVMYGQTEATARITVLPPDLLPAKVGSVGCAIPGGLVEIEVDGCRTRAAATGEVIYSGPNVMLGYARGRADLARGDELQGVLATGDVGRLDDDGLLYVTGRSTRIAKVFGLRVNLEEIEAAVQRHGPAAAVGADDRLVIFCEYGDQAALEQHAGELATRFRVNRRAFDFRRVTSLPVMANGKIDYRALQDDA